MSARTWWRPLLAVAAMASSAPAGATTLQQFGLKDLVAHADKVFRGRVVAIDTDTVRAGGGDLPAVIYRLRVEEPFKGDFAAAKDGGDAVVEIRMIGVGKGAATVNGARRLQALRDLPELSIGREYVLCTTRPSAVGLSTTVGLGQGAFLIEDAGKDELTVNGFGNRALARGAPQLRVPDRGPMPYRQLAQAIRDVMITEVLP